MYEQNRVFRTLIQEEIFRKEWIEACTAVRKRFGYDKIEKKKIEINKEYEKNKIDEEEQKKKISDFSKIIQEELQKEE